MTDRDKLIELILQSELEAEKNCVYYSRQSRIRAGIVADYLLEKGVIVPPVKVGEECIIRKIYTGNIATEKTEKAIFTGIAYLTVNQNGTQIMSPENIFTVDETEKEREQK